MEYRKERLIIVVKSCQKFRTRQEACCATWAGELSRARIPLWFIEGGHAEPDIVEHWIRVVSRDDYNANSFKLRDALSFLMQHDPFERIFICDDDTFVHPRRFLAFNSTRDFVGLESPPSVPWVHGGAGWFMSRRATELFVAGIKRCVSWDDRLASEILATHNILIENHPELFSQWKGLRVAKGNDLITCHPVNAMEMLDLYRATLML